jgi:uracil-DNA glycosylase
MKKAPPQQIGLPFEALSEAAPAVSEHAPVAPEAGPPATQLLRWSPDQWPVAPDWQELVARFFASGTARRLGEFVQSRLEQGAVVYPPQPLRALALTPLARVRVVILGQDPYHGPGQAQGLSFSVPPDQVLPPSLRNIFQEIARERQLEPALMPSDPEAHSQRGSLLRWARQGVLLLNTCLTVEQGQPASHANKGWEALTASIIGAVASSEQAVAFLLWGAHAQARRQLVEESGSGRQHLVLTANHPSPLSALRPPQPFMGCGHFSRANRFLLDKGGQLITW